MKIVNVNLAAVAVKPAGFPEVELPEVAFVGRSNVGKSSLINSLINRKAMARVSQSPGKTRTINFYDIDGKMYFVDLPGYGFARGPKEEIAGWGKMVEGYLKNRKQLMGIIQLLDIRHKPSAQDLQMVEWLKHYEIPIIYALTKMDKLNRSQIPKHVKIVREALGEPTSTLMIPFSSQTKQGKEELLDNIEKTTFRRGGNRQ